MQSALGDSDGRALLGLGSATAKLKVNSWLSSRFTIVIVTHSGKQAARVSHRAAYFLGRLVEVGPTKQIFTSPQPV